ncbi:hypothetical protein MCOR27_006506 [Pyricularia oryzae]|uniref:Uncharacterized protein n=2 Tax=Pyricularia TaxID=48558 RepID=A0ABQ8NDE7_PYRGI|nr:hypothetical protein MCOR19_007944 [Pyricularia oryzae]KAI6295263.1 hypothetical protein MCOR33_007773 [Pyricularia grisea]KAI6276310.1 hypothetical protein MCOR27_006506 [Pyricularia oryzae]KAI6311926.1 hypothetical protein MCOR29_008145 [Pyricularia oryzae]KAI6342842.1 hypothetical protein MCOR30_001663 [Pyricularia oryzae]
MDEHVFRADSLSGNTYEIDTEAHVQDETEGLQSVEVNEPCCATVRMMVAKLKGKNPKRQHCHREKYIVVVIAGGEAKAGAWTEVETATFQVPFSLDSEDTETHTQQLRTNEVLMGARNSPAIEIYDPKYTGNDLFQGPRHSELTTFHDPEKQERHLFRGL